MPWFIVQCERKTWTKYIVEAENKEAALESSDDWQYLGYVDGDDIEATVSSPFDTKSTALADIVSYSDG
jgi:hypothetical protein